MLACIAMFLIGVEVRVTALSLSEAPCRFPTKNGWPAQSARCAPLVWPEPAENGSFGLWKPASIATGQLARVIRRVEKGLLWLIAPGTRDGSVLIPAKGSVSIASALSRQSGICSSRSKRFCATLITRARQLARQQCLVSRSNFL